MKKALRLTIALLFAFAGIVNAQTVVNFEDGQIPSNWTNDATYPWTVINLLSSTGNYCIQSGNAGESSSSSSISTTVSFASPGYVVFDANCMGEGTRTVYDKCIFKIDADVIFEYGKDIEGWNTYGFDVPAGNHTFTWTYEKDGSVNPDGDCFQIDNVMFGLGTACVAPSNIQMTTMYHLTWIGAAETYTLRYKKGSGSWTNVTGITENEYDATSLNLHGDYTIEIQADCDPNNWASAQFHFTESTADWYGFVSIATDPAQDDQYINFSIQDPTTMTAVSSQHPEAKSTAFVNGYVWSVNFNPETSKHMLCKSPIDIYNKTIGNIEIVNEDFPEITSMAYNPADGLIYYATDDKHLKSFNPANPGPNTEYGELEARVYAFAINNEGTAYVINNATDYFCTLNLTNATMTEIAKFSYMSCLAFDKMTGELFGISNNKLYYINKTTVEKTFIGYVGGTADAIFVRSLFMTYDWNAVSENHVESLNVYPNPANDMLYIDGVEGETVRVYDNTGRLVKQEQYNGHLDVSNLAQGIYAVTAGDRIVKFVKK